MNTASDAAIRHWRRWLLVIWLLTMIAFVFIRWGAIQAYMLPDTDDNMRMAQVRALLAGQDWFDLRQYKLNPPAGYNMHWSRFVDLPIAAIQLVAKPLFGGVVAQKASAAIAPMLPFAIALFGVATLARRIVHPGAFAIAAGLLLCCQSTLLMFLPMRVDHHGWQLALLIVGVAGLADPDRVRGGLTTGLTSALSLVIGLELMPFLVIIGGTTVLRWVRDADESERMRAYGAALAGGCICGYLAFASYDNRLPRCDVLSPVWLSIMTLAGALAYALSLASTTRWTTRLLLAGLAGVAIAAFFALGSPQCLGRPEQTSDELYTRWFTNVREAKPLYMQTWTQIVSTATLPLIGIGGALYASWAARGTRMLDVWLAVATVSVLSALLLLWQTRAGPAAQLLAIPGATALAWAIFPRLARHRSMLVRTIGVVAAFLVISGLIVQLVIDRIGSGQPNARLATVNRANTRCPSLAALRPVDALPRTIIFTFVDLGPRLINVTRHSAVAGPYHRNGAAILDVHNAFQGTPDRAHAIMHRHGATLLMTCPNMSEATVHRAKAKNGFYSRLAKGERFDWLTPVRMPKGSPLLVWKIS